MSIERGRRLGHYVVQELLGQGGMGEVYAAEDTRLKRRVAIKVLPESLAQDESRRLRFEREAQSVAALNHPNIVTLHSVEHDGATLFLTMELVEGRPLGDVITARGMPLGQFFGIAIPLADAVSAAHARGITHRDLKPGNIMIGGDGRPKVLDFGLAKLVESAPISDLTVDVTKPITADGNIVGTTAYMAPEQAEGRSVDARSDLFSLGIILYEMLAGERPFKGDSTVSVLSSIIKDTPRALPELNAAVPRELWQIVRRCLAKDPEKRLQSAKDLRNELDEVKQAIDSGELAAPVSSNGVVAARRAGPWRVWVAAAMLFLALAAVPAWRYLARSRTAPPTPATATFSSLTTQAGVEDHPSLSPDGKWMVYASDLEGNLDIFLQSVGGQNAINLTKDSPAGDDQPAFSPDGEQIAFRSSRDGGGVFVMGRTGDLVRKVAPDGFNPAWSPDGQRLAFSSQSVAANPGGRTQNFASLSVVDVATGESRRLAVPDGLQPSWSPDGRWIAYWGMPAGTRNREIWLLPSQGGESIRVTDDPAIDWNPVWGADSSTLYFGSDRGGLLGLWSVGIDPQNGGALGAPQPIQLPAQLAAHFSFSADGSRMLFASVRNEQQVYTADFDPQRGTASGAKPITLGSRTWFYLDVSPDGNRLALVSRYPQEDIFVASATGENLKQITNDPASDRGVRWSPDGQRILFYSGKPGEVMGVLSMAPDGSDRRQITKEIPKGGASWVYPQWAPDGKHVSAFILGTGSFIFEDRGDSGWIRQTLPALQDGRQFVSGVWSADGRSVVGVTDPGGEVVVYDVEHRTFEMTGVSGFSAQGAAAWFPDRRRIIAVRGRSLVAVDLVSAQVSEVLTVPGQRSLTQPRLTADGKRLYYLLSVPESDITLMTMK